MHPSVRFAKTKNFAKSFEGRAPDRHRSQQLNTAQETELPNLFCSVGAFRRLLFEKGDSSNSGSVMLPGLLPVQRGEVRKNDGTEWDHFLFSFSRFFLKPARHFSPFSPHRIHSGACSMAYAIQAGTRIILQFVQIAEGDGSLKVIFSAFF